MDPKGYISQYEEYCYSKMLKSKQQTLVSVRAEKDRCRSGVIYMVAVIKDDITSEVRHIYLEPRYYLDKEVIASILNANITDIYFRVCKLVGESYETWTVPRWFAYCDNGVFKECRGERCVTFGQVESDNPDKLLIADDYVFDEKSTEFRWNSENRIQFVHSFDMSYNLQAPTIFYCTVHAKCLSDTYISLRRYDKQCGFGDIFDPLKKECIDCHCELDDENIIIRIAYIHIDNPECIKKRSFQMNRKSAPIRYALAIFSSRKQVSDFRFTITMIENVDTKKIAAEVLGWNSIVFKDGSAIDTDGNYIISDNAMAYFDNCLEWESGHNDYMKRRFGYY